MFHATPSRFRLSRPCTMRARLTNGILINFFNAYIQTPKL